MKRSDSLINIIYWVLVPVNRYKDYVVIDQDGCVKDLIEALNRIKPREVIVLALRSAGNMTLRKIGENLGITGQRVRQIESAALRKLRHPTRRCYLEKHLTFKP